jgi:hypothetical protein
VAMYYISDFSRNLIFHRAAETTSIYHHILDVSFGT